MHVITRRTLDEYAAAHPDARTPLEAWYQRAGRAEWANLAEVRRDFPHADGVAVPSGRTMTVFNVGGNKYRLIVGINFRTHRVYIKAFLTHAEYDDQRWKETL